MIETKRIVRVLTDLEGVNEDLLNLFEEIQRSINPHDRTSRTEEVRLLAAYSDKLDAFQTVSNELHELLERITHVDVEREVEAQSATAVRAANNTVENERIVRALDREQPHTLTEDFTSKRPYGFTLMGRAFRNIETWRRLYQMLCQQLASRDQQRFLALPSARPFSENLTSRFSTSTAGFRGALKLPLGLYAEANVNANATCRNMRHLLNYFAIPESEMVIYLREDRDAE